MGIGKSCVGCLRIGGNAAVHRCRRRVAVRVCCEADEDDARKVVMRVTDTGIGIPKEAQGYLRAVPSENMSTVRRYGGGGLGLSLVKDLVTMMGGTVAVVRGVADVHRECP
ncbi:MAG: ATP-binding protein [Eggerthella lenta]